jgi:hypothetical protein
MLTRYRWFAGTLARQAGREIRMIIDGTDPVAASKPDGRLIKLLVRGAGSTRPSAAAIASHLLYLPSEGVNLSYHSARPRLSYLAPDITQAILDGRQPRALSHLIDLVGVISTRCDDVSPQRFSTVAG